MDALRELQSIALDYILLLFLRVAGIIWSSPIFGRTNIPAPARICFAIALTYFFYTSVPITLELEYATMLTYGLLCLKEILIGVIMGYILTMFFSVAQTAGQLIDMQLGLGMASVYDPQMQSSVPLLGNMLNVMLTLIFFAIGGYQELIGMLYLTIVRIPIGGVTVNFEIIEVMIRLFVESFLLGIRMSLPILASGMLVEAIMGMIIHAVPQMNMFVIGMPLKVVMGFTVLLLILPVYSDFSILIFERMFEGMESVFSVMAGT